jgi:hypothetical protein
MDFDKNQFLQDVFEALVALPGDPVTQIDGAVFRVVAAHAQVLGRLAQAHREDLLGMADERKRTGQPVPTRWKV